MTLILGIGRPSKGTTMKAFLITVALAFSSAIFAANDAQAGVSFQSLSLLKFVGQASLVDEAMLPS